MNLRNLKATAARYLNLPRPLFFPWSDQAKLYRTLRAAFIHSGPSVNMFFVEQMRLLHRSSQKDVHSCLRALMTDALCRRDMELVGQKSSIERIVDEHAALHPYAWLRAGIAEHLRFIAEKAPQAENEICRLALALDRPEVR